MNNTTVAVVGGGVSGCSSALALIEQYPDLDVTVFADRPFTDTTSYGPPGIFALDYKEYKHGVFFTTFTTEGRTYVPWLMNCLKERKVKFEQRKIGTLQELGNDFDFVVNCAGVDAGKIAGDDDTVVPARGVLLEVVAPWQKHFISLDIGTAVIPTTKSLFIGTLKQVGRSDRIVTQQDRDDIWERNLKILPTLKNAEVISEWAGLRPTRKEGIRLEMKESVASNGKQFHIVHNYGHGSNGFTLSWGCATEVVELVGNELHHQNTKM